MKVEALGPAVAGLWERLAADPGPLEDFYLAGSAALALHLRHREPRGLDFMSLHRRLASAERRDLLQDLLGLDQGFRVETARDGYLFARLSGGPPLRFHYYPYPLLDPLQVVDGLEVAALVDLGAMKLGAVISRGLRRDFLDLHAISRRLPLGDLLARAGEKFGHVRDFELQALKGLSDLSAVGPDPVVGGDEAWEEVVDWLETDVRDLARAEVGLAEGNGR